MKATNPYRWNQVHLDLFYGRENLSEELVSGLINSQSFALMGGRRMGKTTLLRKIERELCSRFPLLLDGGLAVIPIYVDTLSMVDQGGPEAISKAILDAATEFTNHYFPHTSKDQHREQEVLNPFAQDLLGLVRRFSKYRVQIIVLFDEIAPIVRADWGTIYLGNWRALLHNTPSLSGHIGAVFAGAHEIVSLARDVSSPLANILSWRSLRSFSETDTRLLVKQPTMLKPAEEFYKRVFELTGGHPFLIQYLMFHVVESGSSDLCQALECARILFLENEYRQFHDWFSSFDDTTQKIYEILVTEGAIPKPDLVRAFKDSGSQIQVQSCIDILCSYGVVRHKDGYTYSWSGELFRSWYLENLTARPAIPEMVAQSAAVDRAFREYWHSRLADLGKYNILVEGATDKLYLELAAERYRESSGVDLLENGKVRIVAGRGTKRMGPEFGMLQSLEKQGIRYVVILDRDQDGERAIEAMHRFGAQKNRHYFQLARSDYRDKSGNSWDVEIEDMLPERLVESFAELHPDAIEEQFQRQGVKKYTIRGRPVKREGQVYDYKMLLVEYVRQVAMSDDLSQLVEVLKRALKCLGLKGC
jgi:hypothetical protein